MWMTYAPPPPPCAVSVPVVTPPPSLAGAWGACPVFLSTLTPVYTIKHIFCYIGLLLLGALDENSMNACYPIVPLPLAHTV